MESKVKGDSNEQRYDAMPWVMLLWMFASTISSVVQRDRKRGSYFEFRNVGRLLRRDFSKRNNAASCEKSLVCSMETGTRTLP